MAVQDHPKVVDFGTNRKRVCECDSILVDHGPCPIFALFRRHGDLEAGNCNFSVHPFSFNALFPCEFVRISWRTLNRKKYTVLGRPSVKTSWSSIASFSVTIPAYGGWIDLRRRQGDGAFIACYAGAPQKRVDGLQAIDRLVAVPDWLQQGRHRALVVVVISIMCKRPWSGLLAAAIEQRRRISKSQHCNRTRVHRILFGKYIPGSQYTVEIGIATNEECIWWPIGCVISRIAVGCSVTSTTLQHRPNVWQNRNRRTASLAI